MRLLLLAWLLIGGAVDDASQKLKRKPSFGKLDDSDVERLEDTGRLAKDLEEMRTRLKECRDQKNCGKIDLGGFRDQLDSLAERITAPLKIPEGKHEEVREEFQKIHKTLGKYVSRLKQSVDGAAKSATDQLAISDEKWDSLWSEVGELHSNVVSFLGSFFDSDNEPEEEAMFSWNWADSHIPGLRWIQSSLDVEVWKPVPNAETLQKALGEKVKSDWNTYGTRDLRIRVEKTGKIKTLTSPNEAIKWLEQYKVKEDL